MSPNQGGQGHQGISRSKKKLHRKSGGNAKTNFFRKNQGTFLVPFRWCLLLCSNYLIFLLYLPFQTAHFKSFLTGLELFAKYTFKSWFCVCLIIVFLVLSYYLPDLFILIFSVFSVALQSSFFCTAWRHFFCLFSGGIQGDNCSEIG